LVGLQFYDAKHSRVVIFYEVRCGECKVTG